MLAIAKNCSSISTTWLNAVFALLSRNRITTPSAVVHVRRFQDIPDESANSDIRRDWPTDTMEYQLVASAELDVCELGHLGPLIDFVSDEPAKVGRAHRHWNAAQFDQPRLQRGIG